MAKKEYYYEAVLKNMMENIESGVYQYGQLLPPERDLAEQYQVNRTTIRKALELLTEDGYIVKRQGSGNRVVYQKDGWQSAEPAEDIPHSEEKMIGFFIPGGKDGDYRLEQPFYMNLYYYVELGCRGEKCRVVCITVTDLEDFKSVLKQYRFAGICFMAMIKSDIVACARENQIPVVTVNGRFPNTVCVTMDNVNGGYLAVKYLLEKGHRKISYIVGPENYFTSQDRMLGAIKACNEIGLLPEKEQIVAGDWTFSGGYQAMQEILARPKEMWPTAVFAFNEEMSYGAMKAISEHYLKVPEDISLIGFDNALDVAYAKEVTTIDGNIEQVARVLVRTLMNAIDGKGMDSAATIVLPVRLLEHGSVKDLTE